jgi:hypothetical protein
MSNKRVHNNHIVSISNNILRNISQDTEQNLNVSNLIQDDIKNINSNTYSIRNKDKINDGKSQVNLIHGSPVWADSNPPPFEDRMRRDGWYYQNKSLNDKINLYFFDGLQETFKLGDVQYLYAKLFVDRYVNNVQNLPFLHIYTKPTGSGDAGAFYHSKVDYVIDLNTAKIGLGEECYFFGKAIPEDNDKWFSNRSILLSNVIKTGECLDDEEILYFALGTDSGAMPFLVNIGIQELGFSCLDLSYGSEPFKRKLELIGFINDDVIHHEHILKNVSLPISTNTLSDIVRVDNSHGNISWWVQSNGIILSNHIGVDIEVSNDGTLFETIPLNSKFVESEDGVYSRFGNLKDFKPTFIRVRTTNNGGSTDNFNVYLSY